MLRALVAAGNGRIAANCPVPSRSGCRHRQGEKGPPRVRLTYPLPTSGFFDGATRLPPLLDGNLLLPANAAVRIEPVSARPGVVCGGPTIGIPSFPDIYRTYFSFVWSIARQLGVNQAELDDVVQEIFITIHARAHTIERPESLRSWIYGIIRRNVSTYHRTKRTRLIETGTARIEPEMVYPDWSTPQQLAEQSECVKLLWSLLEKIDASKREVFMLAELEEMTAPEIAAAIDVPLNTVYSRLRSARQELGEALRRHNARTREPGESSSDSAALVTQES